MNELKDEERREHGSLLEDTLGFNLRSVRTLADLWIRPRAVMGAIIARDRETYTPMVRLFLALVGLQVAVSVLWGGYGQVMRNQLAAQGDEQAIMEMLAGIGVEPDAFFSAYGTVAPVLHAPIVAGFTALSAVVLARFGGRRPLAVNLNLVFATLTAGSIVGLAAMCLLIFRDTVPQWSILVIAIAYFITWLRGLPTDLAQTSAGRLVKSGVMTGAMFVLILIGATVMQACATVGAIIVALA